MQIKSKEVTPLSKNRIKAILIAILAVVAVLGVFGINNNYKEFKTTKKQSEAIEKKLESQKKAYKEYKENVSEKALSEGQQSDNVIIKNVSDYNSNEILGDTVAEQFFKVFYTWNDGDEYTARAGKLEGLISDGVKDNKTLFDDGKDTLGDSYIDTSAIKSIYKDSTVYQKIMNNNQIEMLVDVSYESWRGDNHDASGDSNTFYKVTYDKATGQINKVEKAYPLKNSR